MPDRLNDLGQPIGPDVPGWSPRPRPPRTAMMGTYCRLEPTDVAAHASALHAAFAEDTANAGWTYLGYGPFPDLAAFTAWLTTVCSGEDPVFYTIFAKASTRPLGLASYLRIDPAMGSIEVGHLHYGPRLQRTPGSTEAMYLLMRRAFDELGYRRYEWKCDALNAPSRQAAIRLGFTHEGTFRQAGIYKGRSRDTAWFSITDAEWPERKAAFAAWLAPENFDRDGNQRSRLGSRT